MPVIQITQDNSHVAGPALINTVNSTADILITMFLSLLQTWLLKADFSPLSGAQVTYPSAIITTRPVCPPLTRHHNSGTERNLLSLSMEVVNVGVQHHATHRAQWELLLRPHLCDKASYVCG